MERKLYISDLHFGHRNVTKDGRDFDDRPFKNVDEMHEKITDRWNQNVNSGDHVYILGDLLWKLNQANAEFYYKLLKRLNGNKHWILGNHDEKLIGTKGSLWRQKIQSMFEEIVDYKEVVDVVNGKIKTVIMSHYYMPFYNHHYGSAIMLHGHSHNSAESDMERRLTRMLNQNGFPCEIYNVGCMYPYIDYAPRSLQYIVDHYKDYIASDILKKEQECDSFEDLVHMLITYHKQTPELRFGQTVVNLFGKDPFYIRDIDAIESIANKIRNQSELSKNGI